jgi:hypothetical protein
LGVKPAYLIGLYKRQLLEITLTVPGNNSEPILYISNPTVYFPKIHLTFNVHTPSLPSKRLFLEIFVLKFTGSGIHPASYPVASRSPFSRDKTAKIKSKLLASIQSQDM